MFDTTHFISVRDDVRLAYCDSGGSPPHVLLMLHGLFDHKGTWRTLVEHLPHIRCIAPDLVGHGQSGRPALANLAPAQRYAPSMQADYIEAFIEAMELDSIVLCGSSLGGGIALRLWLEHPGIRRRTRAIALMAAAGYRQPLPGHVRQMGGWLGSLLKYPPVHYLIRQTGLLDRATRRAVERCFYDASAVPDALVSEAIEALKVPETFYAYQLAARNVIPPDIDVLSERLAEIDVPTLIVWGRDDRVVSPLAALRFAEDIPDSQVHFFARCGHAPYIEHARETAQLLHPFFQRHTDGSSCANT